MLAILLITHLMAMGVGVGIGVANMIIGGRAAAVEGAVMGALRGAQGALGRAGFIAIILLWITGIWMWQVYDHGTTAPVFLAKLGFVIILTGLSIDLNVKGARAAKGGPKMNPTYAKRAGMAMGLMSFLAVTTAVIVFH